MTNLRHILAFNMKENRRILGLSQAKLAEKADLSTQYIAMIELCRKFPSPEILEVIATALKVDTPELFSMPPSIERAAVKFQETVLADIEHTVEATVSNAVKTAISKLVAVHLKEIKKSLTANTKEKPIYDDIPQFNYNSIAADSGTVRKARKPKKRK